MSEEKIDIIVTKAKDDIIINNKDSKKAKGAKPENNNGDLIDGKDALNKDTADEKPAAKTKRREFKLKQDQKASLRWAFLIFVSTFILSLSFSFIAQMVSNIQIYLAFVVLIFTIILSLIFDVIAVSTTACSIEPFLAMASKKIKGAKIAVKIVKNAEKVANICGDVIGDICGIISGSLGALIVVNLLQKGITIDSTLLSILFSSSIAAVTVGGKAFCKKFAIDKCQKIIYTVSKILSVFSKG